MRTGFAGSWPRRWSTGREEIGRQEVGRQEGCEESDSEEGDCEESHCEESHCEEGGNSQEVAGDPGCRNAVALIDGRASIGPDEDA
jgi:hypothetical protein